MKFFENNVSLFANVIAVSLGLAMATVGPANAADQKLIEAAKAEGTVVWYTTLLANYLARPMAAAFEAKYPGVAVEMVNGNAGDLYQKIQAESAAGQIRADVHGAFSVAETFVRAGMTEPYIPESARGYASEYIDPDGKYLRLLSYYIGLAVNTDLVKPEDYPRTQDDLLKPMWKGRMVWAGGTLGSGPAYIGVTLERKGEAKGLEFLNELSKQNIISMPTNQRVVLDSVISGENLLGIGMYNHHIPPSKAKGAPIEFLKVEPVQTSGQYVFLLKGPHRNAGKLFLDFMMSEEGQRVIAAAHYIPTHPNVLADPPELRPEAGGFNVVNATPAWLLDNREQFVGLYTKLFVKN